MLSELKYALRALLKAPSFASITVLVVALSLGLATAAVGLAYEVFVRPLPFHFGDRLAIYCCPFPEHGEGWRDAPGSPAAMQDYARAAQSAETVAIFYAQQTLNVTNSASGDGNQRVPVTFVSADYF